MQTMLTCLTPLLVVPLPQHPVSATAVLQLAWVLLWQSTWQIRVQDEGEYHLVALGSCQPAACNVNGQIQCQPRASATLFRNLTGGPIPTWLARHTQQKPLQVEG